MTFLTYQTVKINKNNFLRIKAQAKQCTIEITFREQIKQKTVINKAQDRQQATEDTIKEETYKHQIQNRISVVTITGSSYNRFVQTDKTSNKRK